MTWLLRIVGALTAPTSMALACRVEEPSTASKTDMGAPVCDVRSTATSRHSSTPSRCPLSARLNRFYIGEAAFVLAGGGERIGNMTGGGTDGSRHANGGPVKPNRP